MSHPLLEKIRTCTACAKVLPHPPRPVLNFSPRSRILVVGQAPGLKVHRTGIPWHDASGDRLRQWLAVDREQFYDVRNFAIVPMGFCYPGRGKSGDLPPRPECAPLWLDSVVRTLRSRKLTILIGRYAQVHFLPQARKQTLTETVRDWEGLPPEVIALPHPSPRNNLWLAKHPWFEKDFVPRLQQRVRESLTETRRKT